VIPQVEDYVDAAGRLARANAAAEAAAVAAREAMNKGGKGRRPSASAKGGPTYLDSKVHYTHKI
jgi:hypothetical protein